MTITVNQLLEIIVGKSNGNSREEIVYHCAPEKPNSWRWKCTKFNKEGDKWTVLRIGPKNPQSTTSDKVVFCLNPIFDIQKYVKNRLINELGVKWFEKPCKKKCWQTR